MPWLPADVAVHHGFTTVRRSDISRLPSRSFIGVVGFHCCLLFIIVHYHYLCSYLFCFSIMFCFPYSGHLAMAMLGAVLIFYSVEGRDSFLSPPLNLCLSNRVFVFYPPDRPRRRAERTRPYPPDCPHRHAKHTPPYPPDHARCRAVSMCPYTPDCPRCRTTSTYPYPPHPPR